MDKCCQEWNRKGGRRHLCVRVVDISLRVCYGCFSWWQCSAGSAWASQPSVQGCFDTGIHHSYSIQPVFKSSSRKKVFLATALSPCLSQSKVFVGLHAQFIHRKCVYVPASVIVLILPVCFGLGSLGGCLRWHAESCPFLVNAFILVFILGRDRP